MENVEQLRISFSEADTEIKASVAASVTQLTNDLQTAKTDLNSEIEA